MTETTSDTASREGSYEDAIRSLVTAVIEAERAKRKYHAETARKWARALDSLAAALDPE